ncbi:hypothetical protein AVEN_168284-1 [Araneus ventricosus]|uniref:Uncharacterized protein n=1 Tax=Araneus ventricosus TaxID=182803 RepID=A0A4Y2FV80_ARAVE|nr:hypothetical protein AVEN_168284-1 [Araneus ventricosus]
MRRSSTVIRLESRSLVRKRQLWCSPHLLNMAQNYKLSNQTVRQILKWNLDRSDDAEKSAGYLNHRSGISESISTKWILTMLIVTTVSQHVEDFCGLPFNTSEHQSDVRDSRILRDNEDVQKRVGWFESHDPFPVSDFVKSISAGIL